MVFGRLIGELVMSAVRASGTYGLAYAGPFCRIKCLPHAVRVPFECPAAGPIAPNKHRRMEAAHVQT